jgi:hypothetical protein
MKSKEVDSSHCFFASEAQRIFVTLRLALPMLKKLLSGEMGNAKGMGKLWGTIWWKGVQCLVIGDGLIGWVCCKSKKLTKAIGICCRVRK